LLDALERLGLTPLEAEVYQFLLSESPATGYRIAQALGRPLSNAYKAVETLQTKGAALTSDDDGTRVARAVAPAELIARQRAEFDRACGAVRSVGEPSESGVPDDRVYHLLDREQVLTRARAMLASARSFVIASITPPLAMELANDFEQAASRGVSVGVKVFEPIELRGVHVQLDPRGSAAVDSGPGQWLALTRDGAELLHALFDAETGALHLGAWTSHPLMVWLSYTGLSSDFLLARVRGQLTDGKSPAAVLGELERLRPFESPASVGKLHLISRYRRPPGGTSRRRRGSD
jgi:sugar-specific transcriptional regulator TrmB